MLTTLRQALTHINEISAIEPKPTKDFPPQGWKYRDFAGKMTLEVYRDFLILVGAENLRPLAMTTGIDGGTPWVRGQFLVSTEGQRLISEYLRDKGSH